MPFAAMTCLLPDKHRRIVRCEKDVVCLHKSTPSLMEVYATQFLSNWSDLTDNDELKFSAPLHLAAVKREG